MIKGSFKTYVILFKNPSRFCVFVILHTLKHITFFTKVEISLHFDSSYLAVIVDLSAYCIVIPSSPEPEQWAPALKTMLISESLSFIPARPMLRTEFIFTSHSHLTLLYVQLYDSC